MSLSNWDWFTLECRSTLVAGWCHWSLQRESQSQQFQRWPDLSKLSHASLTMKAYHRNLVGYSWMHAIKSSSKLSSKLYLPLLLNIRVRSQLTTKNSTTLSRCIGFLKRYSPSELSPQFTQRVAPHARSAAPSAATTTQEWKTAANKNSTLPLKKYIFYLLQEPYESPWD